MAKKKSLIYGKIYKIYKQKKDTNSSRNMGKEYCFGLLVETWKSTFSSFHCNRFLPGQMATKLENIFYSFSCI